jgi:hypothetical protein
VKRIGFLDRLHGPEHPVLVFDGATGTSLQQMNLTAEDFGGASLEGCNEYLVFTRPDAVQEVHRQFLEAGCDVIETDTFGAASIVLAEYELAGSGLRHQQAGRGAGQGDGRPLQHRRKATIRGGFDGSHHQVAHPGPCRLRHDEGLLSRTGRGI